MGQGGARIEDVGAGVCPNHPVPVPYTTVFYTGASSVLINGRNAAFVTTLGKASCGHDTTALTGSATVFIEGKAAHRLLDTGANFGPYQTDSASLNVIMG